MCILRNLNVLTIEKRFTNGLKYYQLPLSLLNQPWLNAFLLDRFGSRYRSNVTGILYNDDMADFDIPEWEKVDGISPSPFNFPEPGKRPFSSMSPAILTDDKGDVQLVIGASGGKRITTAVSLVRATDKPELYADTAFFKRYIESILRCRVQSVKGICLTPIARRRRRKTEQGREPISNSTHKWRQLSH